MPLLLLLLSALLCCCLLAELADADWSKELLHFNAVLLWQGRDSGLLDSRALEAA
jgi:hypothetical protein